ncbi:uncharacterized protein LOC131952916 [Physella acuta]|uniref:uncharacterized protein LOC131952916 n=1 Tax=Physella acuta TaxID=109671 RepID=UPI0027DB0928|nr:uncharacterized protein LOC131952916 [Physella acuta]
MMSSFILELDDVIRRYAWQVLLKRSNFLRRAFLDADDYTCKVDWTALTIEHKIAKFSPKVKDGTVIETNWGEVQAGTQWVTLWSCDFDNKADSKQSHAFRGSRDTTTWVDVDLEQCYTVNKEVCVQVNLPQNFSKFRAGRDNSLSLNKVKGQVFKEILTWEVNSQVEVLPSWRAHAQLLARQECSVVEFEIRTTLFNPKGVVPVNFYRKGEKQVAHVVNIENINDAFQMVEEGGVLQPEEKTCVEVMVEKWLDKDGEEHTASHPQIITRGTCVCLSWSDQKVDIKTSPLSMDESTCDGDRNMNKTPVNNLSEKQFTVKSY